MAEEKRAVKIPHNLILENRKFLNISGVSDVDSFDEQNVVVYTDLGQLIIRGNGLHVNKLSVESGELTVEGEIDSLAYTESKASGGGFFSKIFR